jgi:peptidoglycan/xylan/chitin deacetylase (PgdA/CDA1 family)
MSPVLNALTVDVEDYFQVSGFASSVDRSQWDSMESRVSRNTERLLSLVEEVGAKATFFRLGRGSFPGSRRAHSPRRPRARVA